MKHCLGWVRDILLKKNVGFRAFEIVSNARGKIMPRTVFCLDT